MNAQDWHDPATRWPVSAYHEIFTEVRYGETDQMGYCHHATAVLWLELGRVAWLRAKGLSYGKLEETGFLLPVRDMNIRYHKPALFEDHVAIQTRLAALDRVRIRFESRVYRAGSLRTTDGPQPREEWPLLLSGAVELACIGKGGRVIRAPKEFQEIYNAGLDRSPNS